MRFKKGRAIVALLIIIVAISIGLINSRAVNEKTITFEDESLYIQLKDSLGSNVKQFNDDEKSLTVDIDEVTSIRLYKGGYTNIAGIEQFDCLTSLYISNGAATGDDFETNGVVTESFGKLEGLDKLVQLKKLDDLSLRYCQINNDDLDVIKSLNQLKKLDLGQNEISDISKITCHRALEHLNLSDNRIEDINSLNVLDKLTYLDISGNQISDISVVAGMKDLRWLYFAENNVSDISVVANLSNLTNLNLEQNNVSDISVLAQLRNLTEAKMSENHIGDFSPLLEIPGLKISDTYIPVIGKQSIVINVQDGDVVALPKLVRQAFELFTVAEAIDCINCTVSEDYAYCIMDTGVEAARIRVSKGSLRDSIITLKVGGETDKEYKLSETQKVQVREGKKNEQAIIAVPKVAFIFVVTIFILIWIGSIVFICIKNK